jgi:flavin-dependent dehydrogenase
MSCDVDVLVIGAGPAGSATAILLAHAGWRVVIAEQHEFPRRKVCGECIAAGNLSLFDQLGVGVAFREVAGPELRQVGWMGVSSTIIAEMPACEDGPYQYGRALSRDRLDTLLLARARALGVSVLQPAKVRWVRGSAGQFQCQISSGKELPSRMLEARIIVDARGSWEPEPGSIRPPPRASDLFAFKANFVGASLAVGLLPVLSLNGGYGGIVTADRGLTTLACCIRRDVLQRCRQLVPLTTAAAAVEVYLRSSCSGIRDALRDARLDGSWLAVGPLRPGSRVGSELGRFRVGNAAGEAHPLIGEGISMALQSAVLLAHELTRQPPAMIDASRADALQRAYVAQWSLAFESRMRLAAVFAQVAMQPLLARPVESMLRRWPSLLTRAARFAGKARRAVTPIMSAEETV